MSQITIQFSANSPEELTHMLETALRAWSPAARERIAHVEYSGEQATSATMTVETNGATTAAAEPAPRKPRSKKAAAEPESASGEPSAPPVENKTAAPAADIGGSETPADARAAGIKALQVYFGQHPSNMDAITKLQAKYGVKLFAEIPDDKASAFYADAMLIAAGNTEISSEIAA